MIGGIFIRAYGTRAWFALLAFITLTVLGIYYMVNLKLKNESVKYGGFDAFDDETAGGEAMGKKQDTFKKCFMINI